MLFTTILFLRLASSSIATIHNIQVGQGGLTFTPEAISANPGDQVVFTFVAKNHTATQSSFANPCGPADGGFDSNFQPVQANQTDNLPTFTIPINDTKPIWVYCKQAAGTANSHCGAGMVFAVNCGLDGAPNSFTNFKKSALAIGDALKAAAAAGTTTIDGGYTIPNSPAASLVTQTVSLSTAVWTTTYSSYPGSPAPTPASLQGTVHKVIVGGTSGLVFDPPEVTALPRDVVTFEFHAKNHSIVQSSFAAPCQPLNANGTTGFASPFYPVAADATDFPTWNLTVNDTSPIWAFCAQLTHCGQGMVFAVNPVDSSPRNFSAFQGLAKQINGTAGTGTGTGTNTGAGPNATNPGSASPRSLAIGSLSLVFAVVALLL